MTLHWIGRVRVLDWFCVRIPDISLQEQTHQREIKILLGIKINVLPSGRSVKDPQATTCFVPHAEVVNSAYHPSEERQEIQNTC